MSQYLLRRVFLFIPTLLAISLIAFGLSKMSNSSPVEKLCQPNEDSPIQNIERQQADCERMAKAYGLDKPAFYFALRPLAYPSHFYKIYNQRERTAKENLIAQYGNWEFIQQYFAQVEFLKKEYIALPDSINRDLKIPIKSDIDQLSYHYKKDRISFFLENLAQNIQANNILQQELNDPLQAVVSAYTKLQNQTALFRLYIPTIHWYGFDNQYHNWISNFLVGDFGISYYDQRPVASRIWEALRWTLLINVLSILLAYFIAIPLGVFAAANQGTWKDQLLSAILFMLYALPSFWVATMLIVFVTTSEYGMNFFPTGGLRSTIDTLPFWEQFWDIAHHLVLPVFCVTYTAFAFISRQMRGAMLDVLGQDYITTSKAKGLSPHKTIWKHGFRNALFPIITLLASIFPATLAGSVIIEVIFSIPGMGSLAWDAFFQDDWLIVYTILMLAAILTMIGNLVADILYSWADPRVRFDKK